MYTLFLKALKYCLVGLGGMGIDFSITWLLKEKLKANPYLANAMGFTFAAVFNFFGNKYFTFSETHSQSSYTSQFSEFVMISLLGLAVNSIVLWAFHKKLKLNFYISKVLAIFITTFWNFSMNYLITFAG